MPLGRASALLLALLIVASACSGGSSGPSTTGDPLAELSSNTAITLTSCGGRVASDVPAFYRDYFRCVDLAMSGDGSSVVITTHDLPPHASPYYPTTHPNYVDYATDRAGSPLCGSGQIPGTATGCYQKNPNTLAQQAVSITIPLEPVAAGVDVDANAAMIDNTSGDPYDFGLGPVGVALDGVSLFSAFAAPGDDIANEAYTFDSSEGHPTQFGAYHYHRYAPGPLSVLGSIGIPTSAVPGAANPGEIEIYGIMCDGTLVLGATEIDGSTPAGTLDAQGGHTHAIVDIAGTTHFASRYHAHIAPNAIGSNATAHPYIPELRYYTTCNVTNP